MSICLASAKNSPYHGVGGKPLCGYRRRDRVVTVIATDWDAVPTAERCKQCVAKIAARDKESP
jgi:hypothetical protein